MPISLVIRRSSEIEINKTTKVQGNCVAKTVGVNGHLSVQGTLEAAQSITIYGAADINQVVKSSSLKIGGKFRALRAKIDDQIDVAGEAETTQGLMDSAVIVATGSKCAGPIVAGRIEIGKSDAVLADWRGSGKIRYIAKGGEQ